MSGEINSRGLCARAYVGVCGGDGRPDLLLLLLLLMLLLLLRV